LLQLTLQIDQLNTAFQSIVLGTLPITIVKPNVLYNILRNISLLLLGNYEFIVGIKIEYIHTYYELIKVSAIDNAHDINLILEIPLKSVGQIFIR
jgi:alanine-alpha-ketoisovalerate/valine-pyruvate aminotransferase